MKRLILLVCLFLLFFLDCRSTKLLRFLSICQLCFLWCEGRFLEVDPKNRPPTIAPTIAATPPPLLPTKPLLPPPHPPAGLTSRPFNYAKASLTTPWLATDKANRSLVVFEQFARCKSVMFSSIEELSSSQLVIFPTQSDSTLDLFLTSDARIVNNVTSNKILELDQA